MNKVVPKAYIDTCIVSGLAKSDLSDEDISSLGMILDASIKLKIELATSEITKQEIDKIPECYRAPHEDVFNMLSRVPIITMNWTDPGLMMMGVGGGSHEDPLLTDLKKSLPDIKDAEHTFQAAKNNMTFLITVDYGSFLRHADIVKNICGVQLISPVDLVLIIEGR